MTLSSAQSNKAAYCDYHHLQSIACSSSVNFSQDEISLARKEMKEKNCFISSISKFGISLGQVPNEDEHNMNPAAYANGFWVESLNWDEEQPKNGGVSHLNHITLPGWILFAMNTPFEEEARQLSYKFSKIFHLHESDEQVIEFYQAAEPLKSKLKAFGLLDTTKKSIHVTRRAVKAMDAGCVSQSSRVLTIIERYEAIMNNPALAEEIAKLDAQERSWKQDILDMPF